MHERADERRMKNGSRSGGGDTEEIENKRMGTCGKRKDRRADRRKDG
jgi:hypothetical protein